MNAFRIGELIGIVPAWAATTRKACSFFDASYKMRPRVGSSRRILNTMSIPVAGRFSSKGAFAYDELRRRILTGDLRPGDRLPQNELASALDMSITPLREAIRQLASEGLVDVVAHRDVRVASVSAAEAQQLLEVRLVLEPAATSMAVQRRTDEDLERMRAAAARLRPINRDADEDAILAHRAFHRAVYAASHNDVVIRMLDDLWDKTDRYRRLGLSLAEGATARTADHEEHHRLLELVLRSDGGAEALARQHIERSLLSAVAHALDEGADVPEGTGESPG